MLFPFFLCITKVAPSYISCSFYTSGKKSINCLIPKNAKNKGIKKRLIFSLHWLTRTPSSLDAGSSSTACEPPLQKERGGEGDRERGEGGKGGTRRPF